MATTSPPPSTEEDKDPVKERLKNFLPELVKNTVLNPIGLMESIMIPPPGTDPGVKSLYYLQDAYFAYLGARLTKAGVAAVLNRAGATKAAEIVSKTMTERIAKALVSRVTTSATTLAMEGTTSAAKKTVLQQLLNTSASIASSMVSIDEVNKAAKQMVKELADEGVKITDDVARRAIQDASRRSIEKAGQEASDEAINAALEKIAKEGVEEGADRAVYRGVSRASTKLVERAGARAAQRVGADLAQKTGLKLGSAVSKMASKSAVLKALGPISLALDVAMLGLAIFGLIYDLLDNSGIGHVFTRAQIEEIITEINTETDKQFKEANLETYFQDPAEIPLTELIFDFDQDTLSATLTPEWGPMYSNYMDEYMLYKGYSANWRELIGASQEPGPSGDPDSGTETGPGAGSGAGPGAGPGANKNGNLLIIIIIVVVVILMLLLLMLAL
jgi:hypothetical protein